MPALAPGLASGQSFEREIAAICGAMHLQRLDRVDRAGRLEAAGRTEPWAKQKPVGLDDADQQALHHGLAFAAAPPAARASNCWSSARTAAFSFSELALMNSLRSNAARRRTTCAARGKATSAEALTL